MSKPKAKKIYKKKSKAKSKRGGRKLNDLEKAAFKAVNSPFLNPEADDWEDASSNPIVRFADNFKKSFDGAKKTYQQDKYGINKLVNKVPIAGAVPGVLGWGKKKKRIIRT